MSILTLIGPGDGDIAHVERGSRHDEILSGKGWKPLAEMGAKAIRALAPGKLPPHAKPETLSTMTIAALQGKIQLDPKPFTKKVPNPPKKSATSVRRATDPEVEKALSGS